eukprot:gene1028-1557_t
MSLKCIFSTVPLALWATHAQICAHTDTVLAAAACGGSLDVMKWLRDEGWPLTNEIVMLEAARAGHVHVLQWLAQHHTYTSLMNDEAMRLMRAAVRSTADAARAATTAEWIQASVYRCREHICVVAAQEGNVGVLENLLMAGHLRYHCVRTQTRVINEAIKRNQLPVLQWIENTADSVVGYIVRTHAGLRIANSMRMRACEHAALHGHPDIVKWVVRDGLLDGRAWYHWFVVFQSLWTGGHKEVLRCLWPLPSAADLNVDENVVISLEQCLCALAAQGGKAQILQWLRARGCNWNESTCMQAMYNNHISVLKWARENGCPWNMATIYYAYKTKRHCELLAWESSQECPLAAVVWRVIEDEALESYAMSLGAAVRLERISTWFGNAIYLCAFNEMIINATAVRAPFGLHFAKLLMIIGLSFVITENLVYIMTNTWKFWVHHVQLPQKTGKKPHAVPALQLGSSLYSGGYFKFTKRNMFGMALHGLLMIYSGLIVICVLYESDEMIHQEKHAKVVWHDNIAAVVNDVAQLQHCFTFFSIYRVAKVILC